MNSEQLTSILRTALQIGGTLAVSRGWIDAETSASLQSAVLALAGAVAVIGATAWSIYARRKAGIVASAAALPEVKRIEAAPKVADAVPSGKVQPAL